MNTSPSMPRRGEVMTIATLPVITASLTTSIYEVVQIMTREGFRRIPIIDPETRTLQAIVTSTDIINYLGGGEKFQVIQQKYDGSFFKAINEPVKSIAQPNPPSAKVTGSIREAVNLMKQRRVGGLPVVDETNYVWAIVTERDILKLFMDKTVGRKVAELMTKSVVTAVPETSILEAERMMIEKGFRRLPIVSNDKLVGIVNAMDVIRWFGSGEVFQYLRSGTILQVLQTPALKIGTKNVITVAPEADVGEVARIMNEKNIGSLLVVDGERLAGIITERDFFKLISE